MQRVIRSGLWALSTRQNKTASGHSAFAHVVLRRRTMWAGQCGLRDCSGAGSDVWGYKKFPV